MMDLKRLPWRGTILTLTAAACLLLLLLGAAMARQMAAGPVVAPPLDGPIETYLAAIQAEDYQAAARFCQSEEAAAEAEARWRELTARHGPITGFEPPSSAANSNVFLGSRQLYNCRVKFGRRVIPVEVHVEPHGQEWRVVRLLAE